MVLSSVELAELPELDVVKLTSYKIEYQNGILKDDIHPIDTYINNLTRKC